MTHVALRTVDDFRPSSLWTAITHPLHAAFLLGVVTGLLCLGALAVCMLFVGLDVLTTLVAMRAPSVRRSVTARATRIARLRAARTLSPGPCAHWESLASLVERSRAIASPGSDLDALLSGYLNIAMALAEARAYADATGPSGAVDDDAQPISRLRRRSLVRAERAVEQLERQLQTTAALIRLACEDAVAAHCETAAGWWQTEVDDAARLLADDAGGGATT